MRYPSHIMVSLCIGAATAAYTNLPFTVSYTAGVVIGSLLPDIDEPNSYVGRRSFGMSTKVKEAFGHRGMTHSLVVWGAVAAIVLIESSSLFSLGFLLGYLFHILEDFLSIQGVPLLWPFQTKRYKLPLYRTGGIVEKLLFYSSFALFIYIGSEHQLFHEWMRSLSFDE